jgi:hypothetical protein
VTIEHRHRFRSAFVADRAARASARKGDFHKIVTGSSVRPGERFNRYL